MAWVRIEGSYTLPQEQLPEIHTAEGQGFDESSLADDRDTILGKYFDNGFPNATVDVGLCCGCVDRPICRGWA